MPRKTFQNGYPLPASDLNTYLMDQSVQTYASASARTSALATPVEGQVTYLEDTNLLYVYNGSAWVSVGDIADGSITNAKLANSSVTINGTSVALGASATLNPPGNAIINGAFDIWQRGTSGSASSGNYGYGPDRFAIFSHSGTSGSWSQQTFTPGTAPVAGYEGQYFARFTSTNTSTIFRQPIEDVRTFAGQQVTLSFWMKAASAITLNSRYTQEFGSGGSSAVDTGSTSHSITNSWARYTANVTLPSVVGKTIGAGSSLRVIFDSSSINVAVDIWGVQLEAGSVATPFKRNAPSIQAELAACQRYYWRSSTNTSSNPYTIVATGSATSTTNVMCVLNVPVTMRITPSSVVASNLAATADQSATIAITGASVANGSSPNAPAVALTGTGFTQFRPYQIQQNNNVAGYIEVSAEL